MSSTLLSSMKAYKSTDPERGDTIYALIVNTAESNVHPHSYHHWAIACDRKWQVVRTICRMAGDVYSGELKWRGSTMNNDGICSAFVTYGENVLKQAKEISSAIPELDYFNILYFKEAEPLAEFWQNFIPIGYDIEDFWNEKVLMKKKPTVLDLYYCMQIREHLENCNRYARQNKEVNADALREHLSGAYLMPEHIRKIFKSLEKKNEKIPLSQM